MRRGCLFRRDARANVAPGGIRVASILVASCIAAAAAATAHAQAIADNSFLIEEAYNQERGVVQHVIVGRNADDGDVWSYEFTQEWPLGGIRHQFAYTIPVSTAGGGSGLGDIALHYRYQLPFAETRRVAVAPRLSVIVPTGDERAGRGDGGTGFEGNLAMSVVLAAPLVAHWNVGGGHSPSARDDLGRRESISTVRLGQGLVWLAHPLFNVMLESAWERAEATTPVSTEWVTSFTLSPGVRGAINLESGMQIVPGIAMPIEWSDGESATLLFLYLSVEHAFRR
ncbi:MAG: transporter [Gemmatimonadaceae bacterium]